MASGPTAKRLGRVIEAALDEAEVRADPAAAFDTAMAVGRAFLQSRRDRQGGPANG